MKYSHPHTNTSSSFRSLVLSSQPSLLSFSSRSSSKSFRCVGSSTASFATAFLLNFCIRFNWCKGLPFPFAIISSSSSAINKFCLAPPPPDLTPAKAKQNEAKRPAIKSLPFFGSKSASGLVPSFHQSLRRLLLFHSTVKIQSLTSGDLPPIPQQQA